MWISSWRGSSTDHKARRCNEQRELHCSAYTNVIIELYRNSVAAVFHPFLFSQPCKPTCSTLSELSASRARLIYLCSSRVNKLFDLVVRNLNTHTNENVDSQRHIFTRSSTYPQHTCPMQTACSRVWYLQLPSYLLAYRVTVIRHLWRWVCQATPFSASASCHTNIGIKRSNQRQKEKEIRVICFVQTFWMFRQAGKCGLDFFVIAVVFMTRARIIPTIFYGFEKKDLLKFVHTLWTFLQPRCWAIKSD